MKDNSEESEMKVVGVAKSKSEKRRLEVQTGEEVILENNKEKVDSGERTENEG